MSSFEINLNWHLKNNIHVVRIIQNECVISNGNCTHNQKNLIETKFNDPYTLQCYIWYYKTTNNRFSFYSFIKFFLFIKQQWWEASNKNELFSQIFFFSNYIVLCSFIYLITSLIRHINRKAETYFFGLTPFCQLSFHGRLAINSFHNRH